MIRIFFLLFTVALLGCNLRSHSKANIPKAKEMAQILAEVHLAESTLAALSAAHPVATHNSYYKSVLQKHGLSKMEFDSAVAYYSTKPDEYEKIYENVIEILTAKELEIKALKDDIKVLEAKSNPIISAFKAENFWISSGSIIINSTDSTRRKSEFDISTDSIVGGSLALIVRCQLRSTLKIGRVFRNRLKVEYSNGKIDSISTSISSKSQSKILSTTLKLSNIKVKRVFGSLILLDSKDVITADFTDIRLKWVRPLGDKKKRVKLKTVR